MNITLWWQQIPLSLDPRVFSLPPFTLYWYGLFFVAGALTVFFLARKELLKNGSFTKQSFENFSFWFFITILIGAKLGFLLLYWWPFVDTGIPIQGFNLPGMSFFGGAVAGFLYLYWYAKKYQKNFWVLADVIVLYMPLAIFLGRLGNFFHNELYGRVTNVPWGMYFPGEAVLRHPSTLYAAFLEGILLFSILFVYTFYFSKKKKVVPGIITAWFCILYGALRFVSEFFREPDIQIDYIFGGTFNQWLAAILVCIGVCIATTQSKKNRL